MAKHLHKSTKKRLQSNDEEKRLLILEFLMGHEKGGSAHFLQTAKSSKLRTQEGGDFKVLLQTMVDRKWIERQDIDLGNRQQTTYIISENGKKVLETIKKLKEDDNPLAQLGIFDKLD